MLPEIARLRLTSQRLAGPKLGTAAEVVTWMGALQAQDGPAATWAIALRMRRPRAADIALAVDRGHIVRTWPMRRTLHYVPAEDARWMLEALASRMLRGMGGRYRSLGLGEKDLARARRVLRRGLAGGQRLTRPAAYALLERSGVATRGQRGIHILAHLSMEGTLCLGPREGKQPTFVLLDDWVPRAKSERSREDALADLARRYMRSHGPATARDLAWWAGLPLRDARAALVRASLDLVEDDGRWHAPRLRAARVGSAHALPAFDEMLVAYKDRTASLAQLRPDRVPPAAGLLSPTMVLDGQVVALWTRTLTRRGVTVAYRPLRALSAREHERLAAAAQGYADFLGLELELRGTLARTRPGRP
jgi:winged helix DNA-binding protein